MEDLHQSLQAQTGAIMAGVVIMAEKHLRGLPHDRVCLFRRQQRQQGVDIVAGCRDPWRDDVCKDGRNAVRAQECHRCRLRLPAQSDPVLPEWDG